MKNNIYGFIGVFFILLLVIFSIANYKILFNEHGEFLNKEPAQTNILKPYDFYKDHPIFFKNNVFYADLRGINKYSWKIDRDVEGELKFEISAREISKNLKDSFNKIPEKFSIKVNLIRGDEKNIILQKIITKGSFKEGDFSIYSKKNFNVKNSFKKGDLLVFKFTFPDDYENKNLLYGINIPKLVYDQEKVEREKIVNLLIISIDTLRSDYVGVYRKLRGENIDFNYSPNIDEISEQAVVFKNAYTPESATWPALASMMTSKYPSEHGILNNGMQLKFYLDTIGSYMSNLGYSTSALMGNAYGMQLPGFENKFGFFNKDFELIDFAVPKLEKNKKSPFFHWYHFMGVHSNYTPPERIMSAMKVKEEYRTYEPKKIMRGEEKVNDRDINYIRKLYAGELYHLDSELKRIFDKLKSNGVWESTMIVITSDHGEDLYQHNSHFFHYPSLYNTSLKIPLIIKFPYQKKQIVIDTPVSLIDLFPTITEYFSSIESNRNNRIDFSGNSLIPLIKNDNSSEERIIYSGAEEFKIISMVNKKWKFIYNPQNINPLNQVGLPYYYEETELYNIMNDFYEKENVYQENKGIVINDFIKRIREFQKKYNKLKKIKSGFKIKSSEDEQKKIKDRLRTLGYID